MSQSTTITLSTPTMSTMPRPKVPGDLAPSRHFDTARRGYDRGQVEDYLHAVAARLDELRVAAQREQRRAERAERELHEVRAGAPTDGPDPDTGFGQRVERLLRVAETEAQEVRAAAAREAEAIRTQAQEQAERMLREHQEQLERDRMAEAAALTERHGTAERELARLHALHDDVRTRLADLLDGLSREFGGPRAANAVRFGMPASEDPTRALPLGAGRVQPLNPPEPLGRAG